MYALKNPGVSAFKVSRKFGKFADVGAEYGWGKS